ncbi:hypothetical protein PITCH_A1700014 [uncultured Desulfobacterium sp.]|uniref:Uncharacterized protein n=1 Tax=uncultured Desulfobacterium sp. TaxID=201089 RepID=A0A445MUK1_9BACT|nr:hypothetical protein PITCH_A1700014 [uncultured Desulfobacterium sp.]
MISAQGVKRYQNDIRFNFISISCAAAQPQTHRKAYGQSTIKSIFKHFTAGQTFIIADPVSIH